MLILLLGLAAAVAAATYIEETTGLLPVGSPAPEFSATTSSGSEVSLSTLRGRKNVVLFFYPADFTTGCTAQACSIRDGYREIQAQEAVVFGISRDGGESHEKFRTHYNLPFDLIPDTNQAMIRKYGVDRLRGMIGVPKRVTYVIDKEGIIRMVSHHELSMGNHLVDVLRALRSINSRH